MMNMDRFAREAPIILWCISGVSLLRLRFSVLLATMTLNVFCASFSQFFIFIAAFQAGLYGLLAIAVIGVVVSIYYSFGWIKAAFFETWGKSVDAPTHPERTPVDFVTGFALSALALAVVVLGFYQGPLGAWLTPR